MPDFTLNTYSLLLKALKEQQFTFQTFSGFLNEPARHVIILRHDVDARKMNSLQTARIEKELGIRGTYYFRMVPQSYDEEVIKQIAEMGHEIGYHYEDISWCAVRGVRYAARSRKNDLDDLHDLHDLQDLHDKVLPNEELLELAIVSFRENLSKLRRVVPVETICMHGSPLSKYDNRLLWEKYDYREFGIIGEPYFDINFDDVLYLTDTGRRWDGDAVSIRDKAEGRGQGAGSKKKKMTERRSDEVTKSEENPAPSPPPPANVFHFHSTFDIINVAKEKKLPDKIMLTVHPQRWNNRALPWVKEFVWQNIKNLGKRIVKSSMHNSE